jgi:hypothetical protein
MDVRGHDSGGKYSLDVSYLYVNEDQLMVGSHIAAASEIQGHLIERLNRSNSTILTGRARLTDRFSMSGSMSYIDRTHQRDVEHHTGAGYYLPYDWSFRGFGDLSLIGYWSVLSGTSPNAVTVQGGVKLPTGQRNVAAFQGVEPEPSIRPGTGSTDFLAGVQIRHLISTHTLNGASSEVPFTLGLATRWNGRGTDDYRAGNEASVNLAGGYALLPAISLLAQINSRWQKGDQVGIAGEVSHETGGVAVLGTPGVRVRVTHAMGLYGYYQFRIYQRVNSLQLVSPRHLTLGTVYSFGS